MLHEKYSPIAISILSNITCGNIGNRKGKSETKPFSQSIGVIKETLFIARYLIVETKTKDETNIYNGLIYLKPPPKKPDILTTNLSQTSIFLIFND